MRRWIALVAVAGWAALAVAVAGLALVHPSRPALLGALGSGAGLALALLGWASLRDAPGQPSWGALPWWALLVAPVFGALWWGNPLAILLAIPPGVLLAGDPRLRSPLLPRERPRAAVSVVLAYLLLAPPLDALLLGPPQPAQPVIQAPAYLTTRGDQRSLAAGAGGLWETRATPQRGGPAVGVVRVAVEKGQDLPSALRASYAPGSEESLGPLFFFALVADLHSRRANRSELPGDWERIDVVDETTTMFWFFPIPDRSGRREIFLLRGLPESVQLSLLPPFFVAWQRRAGFHLGEAGNSTASIRGLDGNVTIDGVALQLPPEAFQDLTAGAYYRTPSIEPLGLLAAVLLAAALSQRARAKAKR